VDVLTHREAFLVGPRLDAILTRGFVHWPAGVDQRELDRLLDAFREHRL
jgi:hypothetical protein